MTRPRYPFTAPVTVAAVACVIAAAVAVFLIGSSGAGPEPHIETGTHRLETGTHRRALPASSPPCGPIASCATAAPHLFSRDSVWNARVPVDAALDSDSPGVVGDLLHQARTETLGLGSYGGPNLYIATPDAPLVHVALDENNPYLRQAFNAVPFPPGAGPTLASDAHMAIYQPSTDTMWEFWKLSRRSDGWHARWGGRMEHVSTDPGYYRNVVDPAGNVIEQANWGAPSTSLPLMAGAMMISELQAGVIPHALALGISHTCAGVWTWPAQRTDGDVSPSRDPNCVPEGARFRLDPNLNLASLHLPHFIYMMAVAAQRYGIIIDNRSSGFTFYDQDATQFTRTYGYDPYMGRANRPGSPGALYDQWPSAMLRLFPWSRLQLLKTDRRSTMDRTTIVAP